MSNNLGGISAKEHVNRAGIPYGSMAKPYTCCNCVEMPRKSVRRSKEVKQLLPGAERTDSPYLDHLHRLATAQKIVDNGAPGLNVKFMIKSSVMKNDFRRHQQISEDNKRLLCCINRIRRSRGIVDSYNPMAGVRLSNLQVVHVENDRINLENKRKYARIRSVEAGIKTSELLRDWKKNVVRIKKACRYPPILPGICPSNSDLLSADCMDQYRPRAFLDFAVRDGRTMGRIIVMLYPDIVPITTRNFMELVHNFRREQRSKQKGMQKFYTHYVGSPIYKIFHNLYIAMGDMTKMNGLGGRSAAGPDFEQENFIIEANYPGMLAMIPDEDGMVNSKFLITVKPLKVMNGKRVMFGRIIKGLDLVDAFQMQSRANGQSIEPIVIANCGLLPPKRLIKNQIVFDK